MKRALIIHGGWPGHEPDLLADHVAVYLDEEGFRADKANALDVLDDRDRLAAADLIVMIWTMGALSEAQERNLTGAVAAGTGIAGWHGGMGDAFRNSPNYQFMVGGQFVSHPGNFTAYEVNIIKPEDPIVKGIRDFRLTSEQYYMHIDPSSEVLATTTFGGEHLPWIAGTVTFLWRFVARRRAAHVYRSYGKLWQDHERKRLA
ncbi:MAG: ThuA domain-containing protein [Deinococcota bacterium]|nr:ThuA domain-containing protein [Deinococcota bacterium]